MNQLGFRQGTRQVMVWGMAVALIGVLTACSSEPPLSIQALIDEASVGATITIPPGTYRENLSISKSVILVGKSDDSGGAEVIGTEDGEAAIEIRGDVEVTLRDILIIRSNGTGISTTTSARATLENVQAMDCASSGLSVRDQSAVVATDCEFSESDRNGITITGDGHLEAGDCLMDGSAASGLAAVTSGSVALTSCVIQNNGETGLDLGGESTLTLRSVTIVDNGSGEPTGERIFVTAGSALTSQNGSGIWIKDNASIFLEDCIVSASVLQGIAASDNASVQLVRSTVSGNGGAGFYSLSNGNHSLQNTVVTGNLGPGLFFTRGGSIEINGCTVTANEYSGVILYNVACYGIDIYGSYYEFVGHLFGTGNIIPGPGEPDENRRSSCCPESLRMSLELSAEETESDSSGT